jgi:hypothetical protein
MLSFVSVLCCSVVLWLSGSTIPLLLVCARAPPPVAVLAPPPTPVVPELPRGPWQVVANDNRQRGGEPLVEPTRDGSFGLNVKGFIQLVVMFVLQVRGVRARASPPHSVCC